MTRVIDSSVCLPVSISHQSQTAIIPRHLPQDREDKQKNLWQKDRNVIIFIPHRTPNFNSYNLFLLCYCTVSCIMLWQCCNDKHSCQSEIQTEWEKETESEQESERQILINVWLLFEIFHNYKNIYIYIVTYNVIHTCTYDMKGLTHKTKKQLM